MSTPLALARQVASRLNMNVAMVSLTNDFAGDLMQLANADRAEEQARVQEAKGELLGAYGMTQAEVDKPFAFSNGIAVIPVHGSLINRFGQSWGFVTGYNFINRQLALALADDDVEGIILDCNSYGGEVAGCFECADGIYAARDTKPILAVVDSNCYSACYAIASAAHRIVVTPTGGAGSIGAVAMHMSFEKMFEEFGIKVELIYSGDHKIDGNPYKDLPEAVRADIQSGVHASRQKFAALVARNRSVDVATILATEAATYRAEAALEVGLIDEVATPTQAATAFLNELSGSNDNQENTMPTPEELATAEAAKTAAQAATPAAAATESMDAAAVKKAEKERCSAITGCEEAKGNEALANHLAFNTEMSVEDAKQTLAVAKPQVVAAAAPSAAATNPLEAAMAATPNPNVGADGEGADAHQQKPGSSLLNSYKLATGRDLS